jgi:hypothetical protein
MQTEDSPNVSEEHIVTIFRVKGNSTKKPAETGGKLGDELATCLR